MGPAPILGATLVAAPGSQGCCSRGGGVARRGAVGVANDALHVPRPAVLHFIYIEPLVGTVWLAVRKRGGHPCFVADCVYIYIYTHIYIYDRMT